MKSYISTGLVSVAGLLASVVASGCGVDTVEAKGQPAAVVGGGCDGMTQWTANDWRLTIASGEVIEHEGERYQANQDIGCPNGKCTPGAAAAWCSG